MCINGSVSVSETTKYISVLIVMHSIGSLFYLTNISEKQNFQPLDYSHQVQD